MKIYYCPAKKVVKENLVVNVDETKAPKKVKKPFYLYNINWLMLFGLSKFHVVIIIALFILLAYAAVAGDYESNEIRDKIEKLDISDEDLQRYLDSKHSW